MHIRHVGLAPIFYRLIMVSITPPFSLSQDVFLHTDVRLGPPESSGHLFFPISSLLRVEPNLVVTSTNITYCPCTYIWLASAQHTYPHMVCNFTQQLQTTHMFVILTVLVK